MKEFIESVKEFHIKQRFPVDIDVGERPDVDLVRVHLHAEEGVGEMALALAERDVVKLADVVGDLLYVAIGTAVTYGLPAEELLREVCRSNLTKAPRQDDDTRCRDKGDTYSPPDIEGVLRSSGRAL